MAINPLNRSTPVRLMGLSSGLDTDFIIQQSLRIHQMKIDSQFRTRTQFEWKQQSLNGIKDKIFEFRRSFLTTLGENAMRLSSTYNSTVAALSGKNAGAITVTTSTDSVTGSVKIGQIFRLATASAVSTSGKASSTGDGFKLTDKLGQLNFSSRNITFDAGGKANVNINGENITLDRNEYQRFLDDPENDGLGVIDYINTKITNEENKISFPAGMTGDRFASVRVFGESVTIGENYSLDQVRIEANRMLDMAYPGSLNFDAEGKSSFFINGYEFKINKDMTVGDMLKMVNESRAGVTMSYDRMQDKFTVESNKKGADTTLSVAGLGAFGIRTGMYFGNNAIVNIDGEWRYDLQDNDFERHGTKIVFNHTTSGSGVDGKWTEADDITVSLKRDATEPLGKIKSFIEAYNTMVKELEDMLRETKNRSESSYRPLTDEEKSLMTEKQIEDWERIAKKGLLRNDAGIQALTNSLRNSLFERVKEAGLSPSQIGISTGSWDLGLGGQIVLDEEKLRAALEADPARVTEIFMGGATAQKSEDKGWLYRMEDIMNGYVNGSQFASISNLENSIRRANDQMERLQKKMFDEEDRLYKKFSALETAMSKIQQQSDWFQSMLGAFDGRK